MMASGSTGAPGNIPYPVGTDQYALASDLAGMASQINLGLANAGGPSDPRPPTPHTHDDRYYSKAEVDVRAFAQAALPTGTDLDTITAPGSYNVTSYAVAASLTPALPAGSVGGGALLVEGAGSYFVQTWKPAGASTTRNPIYQREWNNDHWTAWHRVDDIDPDKWNSALATRYNKGQLASGTDLDTVKSPGNYYVRSYSYADSFTPALPSDAIGGGAFRVSGGSTFGIQEWLPAGASLTANPIYQREWNNDHWTAWHKVGDLPAETVQQVADAVATAEKAATAKKDVVNYAFSQTAQLAASIAREMGVTETPLWAYFGALGTKQALPVHAGDGQTVHPSIVHIPEGLSGYTYWMAHTPYPGGDEAYEDPNVVASNDGTSWVVPPGLVNPIDDAPGKPGPYNSDNCLTEHPDGGLAIFWRTYERGNTTDPEVLYMSSSVDGITWTPKVEIYRGVVGEPALLSPSIHWDGAQWVLYAIDGTPSPNRLVRATSTAAVPTDDTWTAFQDLSLGSMPAGKEPWHVEIRPYNGAWWGILSDCDQNRSGTNGELYILRSDDGITFQNSGRAVLPQVGPEHDAMYKATFLPQTSSGRTWFQVWYSAWDTATVTWNVFRTAVTTYL